MERLYSVKELANIFGVSQKAAYKYIHRMPHTYEPLRVSESALQHYLDSHTVYPESKRWKSKPIPYR